MPWNGCKPLINFPPSQERRQREEEEAELREIEEEEARRLDEEADALEGGAAGGVVGEEPEESSVGEPIATAGRTEETVGSAADVIVSAEGVERDSEAPAVEMVSEAAADAVVIDPPENSEGCKR